MSRNNEEPKPFKRRQFLVDPEVQIGLSVHLICWIYGYFLVFAVVANSPAIYHLLSSDTRDAAYAAALDQIRTFARFVVVPMGLTFVAMAVHAVFVTHRLAGPMVRYRKALRDIASRRTPGPVTVREKDYFRDIADEMNAAISVLREDAVRRRNIAEATRLAARDLVQSLESRPEDVHAALTRAYSVLDGAERAVRACSDVPPESPPVPLPEKELAPVPGEPASAA